MTSNSVRDRKETRRYTFVIVPDAKAEKTRSFSITRWKLVGAFVGGILLITALVLSVIVFTPVGSYLPISNPELERQYGRQIAEIQQQMHTLLEGFDRLRGYNLKLRRALGEKVFADDTAGVSLEPKAASGTYPESNERMSERVATNRLRDNVSVRMGGRFGTTTSNQLPSFVTRLPLSSPVEGFVTREFEPQQYHYGVDFAGKLKTAIVSVADGRVVFSGWTYDDGFTIIVSHDQGYLTVYKHNQSLFKSEGETVRRGDVIALLGNTGRTSAGPHLHFEVWKDGVVQNPYHYLLSVQ